MTMPYPKRYPGGFVDLPALTTPVDSQFLNAVEAVLAQLAGEAPATDEVGVWSAAGGGALVYQKITNAQIDAAAGIAKSKLAALNIVDADVAGGASIAKSKLAALNISNADVAAGAAIAASKLAAYPSDATKALRGDGTWAEYTVGKELVYGERTSNLSVTTTVADFIAPGTATFLNVPYLIEFYCCKVDGPANAAGVVSFNLYDGATDLGIIAQVGNSTWGSGNFTPSASVYAVRRLTPSAGSHDYKIRAFMSANTGTAYAGAGGAATAMPAFIRIVRAT